MASRWEIAAKLANHYSRANDNDKAINTFSLRVREQS